MVFLNCTFFRTLHMSKMELTCGLPLPPNPIVTTERTVVAPRLVLAGISLPLSVFISQNVTQEQQTINVNGTYI